MEKEMRFWAFDSGIFELARFIPMLKMKLDVEEIRVAWVRRMAELKKRIKDWPGEPRGQPVDVVITDNHLDLLDLPKVKKIGAKEFWKILDDTELLDYQKGEKLLLLIRETLKKGAKNDQ